MTDFDKLRKLHQLREEGILTDAEFEAQKQIVLGQGASSSPPHEPSRTSVPLGTATRADVNVPVHSSAVPGGELSMGFFEAVGTCFSKYADFSGRARRAEYWKWALFTLILHTLTAFVVAFVVTLTIATQTGGAESAQGAGLEAADLATTILNLALMLPGWAVACRRLHDTGRSGWWGLIAFTVIGLIPLFLWLASDSDFESNQYGANPKFA